FLFTRSASTVTYTLSLTTLFRSLDPVHPFVEFGNCDPTVAGGLAQNFDGIVTLLVTDAEGLRGVLVVGTGAGMAHDHYRARSAEIGRAHVCTPVTFRSRMPSSA